MLRLFLSWFAVSVLLFSCAPVLERQYLKEGQREVSFDALRKDPGQYKAKLYILGGVIVETRLTKEGSQIEAMDVPVDSRGDFKEHGLSQGRYLAVLPQERGILDPEVYAKGRRVTMAARFLEIRTGKIDEMEYAYPVFRIEQVHLWEPEHYYSPAYYYDPWFYPFPYYYWDPWWSSPYYYSYPYYNYNYYYRGGPVYPRSLPPNQPPPARAPQPERVPERR